MSDTFPRSLRGVLPVFFLLAASAFLSGCPFSPDRPVLTGAQEDLLAAKGDKALQDAARAGGRDLLAVLVVFRKDVFLWQSSMLDRSSATILNEFNNAALLLVRPPDILPLLADPSVVKAVWFGDQGRLARLDPSLEFEMLGRFGKGTEGADAKILARFRSAPKAAEEQALESAGFKVLSRGGPNLLVSGPMSRIPALLDHDWIVYLEKGTTP